MGKTYLTNIKILIKAESEDEACEALSGALTNTVMGNHHIMDWGYVRLDQSEEIDHEEFSVPVVTDIDSQGYEEFMIDKYL
jgi:hypothetical protein